MLIVLILQFQYNPEWFDEEDDDGSEEWDLAQYRKQEDEEEEAREAQAVEEEEAAELAELIETEERVADISLAGGSASGAATSDAAGE